MRELLAGRIVGICLRDLPGNPSAADPDFDVHAAIDAAASAGARLLHLPSVRAASATLDRAALRAVRDAAASAGVTLAASLPAAHPDRRTVLWGDDPDAASHPVAQIRAARELGVASLHVTVGQDDDRFRTEPAWADQLERTIPVLQHLVDEADVPILLKTHEEMTTHEAVALCEAVPGLRLGFSPVNVVARLEDPVAAAERVAHLVHTVFLDDCTLVRDARGLSRAMRPLGDGTLPWARMLAAIPSDAPVVIDLHRAELSMPVYDAEWLAHQPDVTVSSLADLYASAVGRVRGASVAERTSIAAALLTV